ncbi:MAG: AAA family ATPase [Candidatus Aenigmatarchaeota archaeon]
MIKNEYEKTLDVLKELKLPVYKNSTEVLKINGVPLIMEDVIKGAVISRSNVLLLGERGEGKTQLLNDVLYSWFGSKGTYLRVTPDLDLKNLYQRINLEKLNEARNTDELREITQRIANPITVVDEINRAPAVVQNQLMNICDGYIEINGIKYPLGYRGYSVGMATANFGNGRYAGTFDMDQAILDRFHLIIDIDNFYPKSTDTYDILTESTEPRIIETEEIDHTEEIISAHKCLKKRKTPLSVLIADLYLVHGFDYIDNKHVSSKRKLKSSLSSIEEAHESASFHGLVFPISKRAAKYLLNLYHAMEMVAESKGFESKNEYSITNFFEVAKIALPYSGVLNTSKVETLYYGNPYECMKDVVEELKKLFKEKEDDIGVAIKEARNKKLTQHTLDKFSKDWEFFRDLLIRLNS